MVAPLAGARIEMLCTAAGAGLLWSPLSQGRELK